MIRFEYQWRLSATRLMVGTVYAADEREARRMTGAPRHATFRR